MPFGTKKRILSFAWEQLQSRESSLLPRFPFQPCKTWLTMCLYGTLEPQIPKESQRCILVFGASALHQPISKVIHRAEIFQNFFTPPLAPETILTKEILASALQRENLGDLLFINQLDCLSKKEAAELLLYLQQKLHKPVYGGSLREGFIVASEEAVPS